MVLMAHIEENNAIRVKSSLITKKVRSLPLDLGSKPKSSLPGFVGDPNADGITSLELLSDSLAFLYLVSKFGVIWRCFE